MSKQEFQTGLKKDALKDVINEIMSRIEEKVTVAFEAKNGKSEIAQLVPAKTMPSEILQHYANSLQSKLQGKFNIRSQETEIIKG